MYCHIFFLRIVLLVASLGCMHTLGAAASKTQKCEQQLLTVTALLAPEMRARMAALHLKEMKNQKDPDKRDQDKLNFERELSSLEGAHPLVSYLAPLMSDILKQMEGLTHCAPLIGCPGLRQNLQVSMSLYELYDLVRRLAMDRADSALTVSPNKTIKILRRFGKTIKPCVERLTTIITENQEECSAFCTQVEQLDRFTEFDTAIAARVVGDSTQNNEARALAASWLAQHTTRPHTMLLWKNNSDYATFLPLVCGLISFSQKYAPTQYKNLLARTQEITLSSSDKTPGVRAACAMYYSDPDNLSSTTLIEDIFLDALRRNFCPQTPFLQQLPPAAVASKIPQEKLPRETAYARKQREKQEAVDAAAICAQWEEREALGVAKKDKKVQHVGTKDITPQPRKLTRKERLRLAAEEAATKEACASDAVVSDQEDAKEAAHGGDCEDGVQGHEAATDDDIGGGSDDQPFLTHKQARALKKHQRHLNEAAQPVLVTQPAQPQKASPTPKMLDPKMPDVGASIDVESVVQGATPLKPIFPPTDDPADQANLALFKAVGMRSMSEVNAVLYWYGGLIKIKPVAWCDPHLGDTALHAAARVGVPHIITTLLERGFNPEQLNNWGDSAIKLAAANHHRNPAIMSLFSEHLTQPIMQIPEDQQLWCPVMVPMEYLVGSGAVMPYIAYPQAYASAEGSQAKNKPANKHHKPRNNAGDKKAPASTEKGTLEHPLSINNRIMSV